VLGCPRAQYNVKGIYSDNKEMGMHQVSKERKRGQRKTVGSCYINSHCDPGIPNGQEKKGLEG